MIQEQNNMGAQGFTSDNSGYYAANALQLRLNTDPVLRQIEMYLRGIKERITEDDRGFKVVEIKTGSAKANDEGIQAIMGHLESIFNPQVVQGNFDDEMYSDFLYSKRRAIAVNLMTNLQTYGIKEESYGGILTMIMSGIETFISRLRDNKERESYSQTFKTVERSDQVLQQRSGMKLFGGGDR